MPATTSRCGRVGPNWPTRSTDTHRNADYLGTSRCPTSIRATSDAAEALDGACTVLLAVPSQTLRGNLERWKDAIGADATLVSLAKGIELDTLMRMSQVIVQVTGADPSRVAVRHRAEPGQRDRRGTARRHGRRLHRLRAGGGAAARAWPPGYFRPYTNADVIGAEIGGACKNVIALACGMAAGVGLGENTAAAIITRGLAEIMRLGIALGAKPAHAGRSGRRRRSGGDVHVAAVAQPVLRRTARAGAARMEAALAATGVTSPRASRRVRSVLALASSYDVEMPLTDAVHRVCHRALSVDEAVALLLGRSTKPE